MKWFEAAGLRFGQGLPKICVPLTESRLPALLEEAAFVRALPADLYEWRMDCFEEDVGFALSALKSALAPRPLLCTVRTQQEGGKSPLEGEAYEEFLLALLERGGFGLLDIELSKGRDRAKRLLEKAAEKGVAAVISRHDFSCTPPEEEIAGTLMQMRELGPCLPKYAVTPRRPEDVLALLGATLRASRETGPVITMAMGPLGKVSRVCGQAFGSCMTFGAGKSASAPGQLGAEDLRAILEDLSPEEPGKEEAL